MYLISETTKEEREAIVKESLGNIEASCDGCMSGLAEMYQDYIDGKRELRKSIWSLMRVTLKGKICRAENAVCTENNMMFK